MTVQPRHAGAIWDQYSGYAADDSDDLPSILQVAPEERIGRPYRRSHPLLRKLMLILLVTGSGWAYWHMPGEWKARLHGVATNVASSLTTAIETRIAEKQQAAAPSEPPPPPKIEDAVKEVASPPGPPPPASDVAASETPADKSAMETAAVDSDKLDQRQNVERAENMHAETPEQARALAAGLHPDISHAVLSRLSAADFKNAGIAIKTALAETSDGEAYMFPRVRKGGQALFKVHFVEGAAGDCRRYVVTVTLDGWDTTAAPMEKCGVKRKAASLTKKGGVRVE